MKKFARYALLCFIPIVTGVVCFIVGNTVGNSTVTYVGMLALVAGLPAMMVIFLIVGLILMSTGKLGKGEKSDSDTTDTTSTASKDDNSGSRQCEQVQIESAVPGDGAGVAEVSCGGVAEEEVLSQKEREQEAINAVNSSSHFESRVRLANYEMQNVAEGMKNAPKWGIAVGVTFFLLLVADVITATVLLIKQIFIGAIVCAALFGVVLITAFVVLSVSRAKAMRGDIKRAKKITEGKVKTCFMIGTTAMQTGGNRYQSNNGKTARIKSITYKVIVIADGEEYGALSKRFYETGEKVTVAVMGKKRAIIADDAQLEKIKSE